MRSLQLACIVLLRIRCVCVLCSRLALCSCTHVYCVCVCVLLQSTCIVLLHVTFLLCCWLSSGCASAMFPEAPAARLCAAQPCQHPLPRGPPVPCPIAVITVHPFPFKVGPPPSQSYAQAQQIEQTHNPKTHSHTHKDTLTHEDTLTLNHRHTSHAHSQHVPAGTHTHTHTHAHTHTNTLTTMRTVRNAHARSEVMPDANSWLCNPPPTHLADSAISCAGATAMFVTARRPPSTRWRPSWHRTRTCMP